MIGIVEKLTLVLMHCCIWFSLITMLAIVIRSGIITSKVRNIEESLAGEKGFCRLLSRKDVGMFLDNTAFCGRAKSIFKESW